MKKKIKDDWPAFILNPYTDDITLHEAWYDGYYRRRSVNICRPFDAPRRPREYKYAYELGVAARKDK